MGSGDPWGVGMGGFFLDAGNGMKMRELWRLEAKSGALLLAHAPPHCHPYLGDKALPFDF